MPFSDGWTRIATPSPAPEPTGYESVIGVFAAMRAAS